ncbi:hypothetical protein Tco_0847627 [Tanacetum coccineum]
MANHCHGSLITLRWLVSCFGSSCSLMPILFAIITPTSHRSEFQLGLVFLLGLLGTAMSQLSYSRGGDTLRTTFLMHLSLFHDVSIANFSVSFTNLMSLRLGWGIGYRKLVRLSCKDHREITKGSVKLAGQFQMNWKHWSWLLMPKSEPPPFYIYAREADLGYYIKAYNSPIIIETNLRASSEYAIGNGKDCQHDFIKLGGGSRVLSDFCREREVEEIKALLLAEERFLKIKQAVEEQQNQPEVMQELLLKLMKDLKILNGIQLKQEKQAENPKEITPDLPAEEPDNSLSMRDEHLNTIPETEKSSVENLVPIPSDSKGISDDICDVLSCNNDHFDAEFGLINSLLNRDISITSPKIDFLPEEFAGELDLIDPILPGIDDDDFDEEEGEIDIDIFQIEDEILREKLLNVNLLIDKIEALNLTPSIPFVLEYPSSSPISVVDSDFLIEEVDTFLVPEDSIPPGIESDFDSEGDIIFSNDLLNDDPIPEYERFTFDIEPDAPVINNFDELNEDECFDPGGV